MSQAEILNITQVQLRVLCEAATLVRPGGRLVYATCSLLRVENEGVADAFELTPLGTEFRPWHFPGRNCVHRRTLLPHVEGTDGFFIARWERRG